MFRGEVEPYMKSVEELTAVVQFLKSANPKWDLETVCFTVISWTLKSRL